MDAHSILFCLMVAAAVLVRQVLGFGFSLTLVPIASLVIVPRDAVLVAIALEVVISSLICIEYRHRLRLLEALQLKLASLGGICLGLAMLRLGSPRVLFAICLATGMPLTLFVLFRPRTLLKKNHTLLLTAGLFSGAMNIWGSFSGPPVVLYYLATEESPQDIKGLLTGYFLLVYLATIISLTLAGEYVNFASWGPILAGVLTVVVSYPLSRRLATRLESRFKRIAAGFLLVISSISLLKVLS
jgi:uncharacterized protein